MPTVDVRITSMYPPGEAGSIRGYASATIDSCIGIRGIKVVDGGERGLFVSMPSRKTTEVCFPVTAEFREQLHNAVLSAYQQALEQSVAQQTGTTQADAAEQAGEQPSLQM